jgi:hypothetical protein
MNRSRGVAWKRVQASPRLALQENFPRLPIHDEKEIRVKFKENIIVIYNVMAEAKLFVA